MSSLLDVKCSLVGASTEDVLSFVAPFIKSKSCWVSISGEDFVSEEFFKENNPEYLFYNKKYKILSYQSGDRGRVMFKSSKNEEVFIK